MRLDFLLCFKAVKECKNFSQAAESLYISQSALSKRIVSLENLLGGSLFFRNSNAVTLTPYGEYMSGYIEKLLDDYTSMSNAADDYNLNRQRKLILATFCNFSYSGIVHPITQFEQRQKNFHIETHELNHPSMQTMLENAQADICIAYHELIHPVANYEIHHLQKDPLVLVCSRAHASANGWVGAINLFQAREERFCFPREDSELFHFFVNACRNSGFTPALSSSFVRLGTIAQYMKEGMRCTLTMQSIAESAFQPDIFVVLPIRNAAELSLSLYVEAIHFRTVKQSFVDSLLDYYTLANPHAIRRGDGFFV